MAAPHRSCRYWHARGIMTNMNTPEEFDEIDVTEDEFDEMMAVAEPVAIAAAAAFARQRRRTFSDYYTLSVSDPQTLPASAGRWGDGPQQGRSELLAPVTSAP